MRENPGLPVPRFGLTPPRRAHQPAFRLQGLTEPQSGSHLFRTIVLVGSIDRPTLCRLVRASAFELLQHLFALACVNCFGLQLFAGDFLPRPFLVEPVAQPVARKGNEPGAGARAMAWLLEHDHGNQNRPAKNGNARHKGDNKALRIHPPSIRGGLRSVKGNPRHHPFVGDYATRLRARCRRSLRPRPPDRRYGAPGFGSAALSRFACAQSRRRPNLSAMPS